MNYQYVIDYLEFSLKTSLIHFRSGANKTKDPDKARFLANNFEREIKYLIHKLKKDPDNYQKIWDDFTLFSDDVFSKYFALC